MRRRLGHTRNSPAGPPPAAALQEAIAARQRMVAGMPPGPAPVPAPITPPRLVGEFPPYQDFRAYGDGTSIGATSTVVVVSFRIPQGHIGYLTHIGHETTHLGWDNIGWSLRLGGAAQVGYSDQVGQQWGRVSNPGGVTVKIRDGALVQLTARNPSAAAILASGLLIGYHWPRAMPVPENY